MPFHIDTRTRGDFVVMHLMQHLADARIELAPTIARDFPHAGRTCEKEFHVDELPIGPGFLTMQIYDFEPSKHRVLINGEPLPFAELPGSTLVETWFCWTEVIPEGFLVRGTNTLVIECSTDKESFLIRDVILHWHEPAL